MSNSINFNLANFTFSAEQIRDINELVYEGIEKLPELSAIHQFYRGIIYDKEVGFITGGGLVGKKGQGCDPQTQDWRVSTRKVLWQPKEWEIFLDECADDLKNTMVLYAMNQGTRVDDLTDTDYMAIVVEVLIGAVYKFMYRLIWMSDTNAEEVDYNDYPTATVTEQTVGSALVGTVYTAVPEATEGAVKCALANGTIIYLSGTAATDNAEADTTYYSKDTTNTVTVNEGGYITEDVDPEYFDIIDGLFKQLRGLVADDNTRGVTIAANSQSSKTGQMTYMTPDRAYTLLSDMWYKAPIKLRQMKADTNVDNRPKFLVTQSIADAYEQYLIGKGIDRTYVNLVEGVQVLSFLGVPVVPMAIWDEMIQAYNDLGDTYFKPHRALLTTKSVLAVGTPNGEREFGEFDIWYDKTSRKNYILLKDKLDAKIANPDHFIYAE
jgi:hypothetical protein